jgi:hypothetical protein
VPPAKFVGLPQIKELARKNMGFKKFKLKKDQLGL